MISKSSTSCLLESKKKFNSRTRVRFLSRSFCLKIMIVLDGNFHTIHYIRRAQLKITGLIGLKNYDSSNEYIQVLVSHQRLFISFNRNDKRYFFIRCKIIKELKSHLHIFLKDGQKIQLHFKSK